MSDQIKPIEPCNCGGLTKVLETRQRDKFIYRRRECLRCGAIFPTYESRINPIKQSEKKTRLLQLKKRLANISKELNDILND